MNLYLRLAWRNIWRHRRRTLIVVLAIGMGLALMMFYDGFVAGFEQAIYANAIKVLGGNIQVHAEGYQAEADQNPLLPVENDQVIVQAALAQTQVAAAARRINTGGLASSREGAFSVNIVGIEPEMEQPVSLIAQNVVAGRYLTAADEDVILIGKGLADAMDVGVGDRITLVGRATHNQMRQRTMTVAGIYDVGLRDIEKRTIYISLQEAQILYDLTGQSTEVSISLKQLGQEPAVMNELKPGLNGYEMTSWETNFPEMEAAINAKGGVMNIFSVIILIIAGIGILNLLLMAVYERTREIGLLAALGMKPRQISFLFLLEGAMMGLVGLVFGVVLGLAINGILGQIGFDYSSFSTLTEYTALINGRVYPTLGLDKLLQRGLTVVIIATLAAYYPAREAAQSDPAQALHYV
ncbi:MAG: ABC transporter permease [Chloroflexi bacterium]|jgi:putative ABC transport system permease protein|nr:FtsX-like permease family protein [Anaerolineaceae bacterium]NMB90464.1 ABC transporter permease [Chloroflexota bacterium]